MVQSAALNSLVAISSFVRRAGIALGILRVALVTG